MLQYQPQLGYNVLLYLLYLVLLLELLEVWEVVVVDNAFEDALGGFEVHVRDFAVDFAKTAEGYFYGVAFEAMEGAVLARLFDEVDGNYLPIKKLLYLLNILRIILNLGNA